MRTEDRRPRIAICHRAKNCQCDCHIALMQYSLQCCQHLIFLWQLHSPHFTISFSSTELFVFVDELRDSFIDGRFDTAIWIREWGDGNAVVYGRCLFIPCHENMLMSFQNVQLFVQSVFFFNQFFVLGCLIAPYSFIDGCTDQWSVFCFRRGFKCQSFADLVLHFPSHFQSLQHLLLQIPYPLSTALHLGLLASQLEMESICLIFVFLDALASPSSHPCQRVGQ